MKKLILIFMCGLSSCINRNEYYNPTPTNFTKNAVIYNIYPHSPHTAYILTIDSCEYVVVSAGSGIAICKHSK